MKKHIEVLLVFMFVIIDANKIRIPTFYHFYDLKREYDVILYQTMQMMRFVTGAYHISNGKMYNHKQSCGFYKNDIIFSFLIMK